MRNNRYYLIGLILGSSYIYLTIILLILGIENEIVAWLVMSSAGTSIIYWIALLCHEAIVYSRLSQPMVNVDPEALVVCEEAISDAVAQGYCSGKINFFVKYDPLILSLACHILRYPNAIEIHFGSGFLKKAERLGLVKTVVAHELGHIHKNCWGNTNKAQISADAFAADLYGKEKMRRTLIKLCLEKESGCRLKALQ